MEKRSAKPPPRLSVLDRLLQGDNNDTDNNVQRSIRAVREAVRRDLELLLNTRPRCQSWPAELTDVGRSIVSFGLPDLQTRAVATPSQREAFRVDLEAIIRRYEPRFRDLSVELVENVNSLDRTLRFRIHAVLTMDADSEVIVYDTLLDPASRSLFVSAPKL